MKKKDKVLVAEINPLIKGETFLPLVLEKEKKELEVASASASNSRLFVPFF